MSTGPSVVCSFLASPADVPDRLTGVRRTATNFMFIDDAVKAVVILGAERAGRNCRAGGFNTGYGRRHTRRAILRPVERVTGRAVATILLAFLARGMTTPHLSATRAAEWSGWQGHVDPEAGMARLEDWQRGHLLGERPDAYFSDL